MPNKILITGGAGFIGSHFVRLWITDHPLDEVVVLDALTYAGLEDTVQELKENRRFSFIKADICDSSAVKEAMSGCSLVVHFAAETHVDRSIVNPSPFVRTNVEGTQMLLKHAVWLKVPRFVHISTDEVYGPILKGAHKEGSALNPRSPYAASKASADMFVNAMKETHGLGAIIVRPTNAFGPRQFPEKFIPLCITNALQGDALPLYGDGLHRRTWIYVGDLCRAIEWIAQSGREGQIYNVSGSKECPNLDVARGILKILGKPKDCIKFVPDRPGHDRRYCIDDSKARSLGWKPKKNFEEGLKETIDWYTSNSSWWKKLKEKISENPCHWLDRPSG